MMGDNTETLVEIGGDLGGLRGRVVAYRQRALAEGAGNEEHIIIMRALRCLAEAQDSLAVAETFAAEAGR